MVLQRIGPLPRKNTTMGAINTWRLEWGRTQKI